MGRKFTQYADDLADPANAVHVSVDYCTTAGAPATWSRWTDGPDLEAAMHDAAEHVRGFRRCMKINGGSASLTVPRRA